MDMDALVIGGGVIGLATAQRLASRGLEVAILEAESAFGTATSSRNSEVIHAGIHHPPETLKARLCVRGRRLLLEWCDAHRIPCALPGKLIVAVEESGRAALESRHALGRANGVEDLKLLTAEEVGRLEPDVRCVAALHSPGTGIVDSHAFMRSLLRDAESRGSWLARSSPVEAIHPEDLGFQVRIGGDSPCTIRTRRVVNAAGIHAPSVARCIESLSADTIPRQWLAKGNYFDFKAASPFRHLVYPIPQPGGLGIHVTLDLAGRARFGPDVEWIDAPSHDVEIGRQSTFEEAIRRWWPGLPDDALHPAHAGVRPKLSGPGEPEADFCIQGPADHDLPGLVQLFGIESPGLTASLAIADAVLESLEIGS
jgi:L-2-hydroxyglutarate oxidase LhgO